LSGSAVLISQMDPPPGENSEFDAWYAEEYMPLLTAVPGFLSAARGWAVQGEPSRLVVYFLDSRDALANPEYQKVKNNPSPLTKHMLNRVPALTRYLADNISDTGTVEPGKYLYLVTFEVPEDFLVEFDAWYEKEHLPLLMSSPAWTRCRRYDVVDSEPGGVTRAAVHELADLSALDSPERARARATPWRTRLTRNSWFSSARYAVYERF
jgi:hypothetical protein